MKIIQNEKCTESTSVALGFFDGLHIAHKAVINKVLDKENSCVLTFLADGFSKKTLISDNCKADMLSSMGIDYLRFLDFNSVKDLEPLEFVEKILVNELNAKFVCCGYNFRFGKGATGDAKDLARICSAFNIETEIVDELDCDSKAISTTRIKDLLSLGNIKKANELLGYDYFIETKVIHGNEIGRRYGFPTVNQEIPSDRFVTRFGVYASIVTIDGNEYMGVTNIGTKPTVSDDNKVICETNIIGFDGDLYGKTLPIKLVEFIRDEKKFADMASLMSQVECDREKAINLLTKGGKNG